MSQVEEAGNLRCCEALSSIPSTNHQKQKVMSRVETVETINQLKIFDFLLNPYYFNILMWVYTATESHLN